MVAVAENLTFAEFQAEYAKRDQSYEFWYGQAIPKSMPTWIHGLLQVIIAELLKDAGYVAGSEVELRIDPAAHPKPDVIATRSNVETPYPTKAVDVVVEILSADDSMTYLVEKCQTYQAWGFPGIYVVDSKSRLVFRWTGQALEITNSLSSVPAAKIWQELDLRLAPPTPHP